eukprot:gene6678-7544_t
MSSNLQAIAGNLHLQARASEALYRAWEKIREKHDTQTKDESAKKDLSFQKLESVQHELQAILEDFTTHSNSCGTTVCNSQDEQQTNVIYEDNGDTVQASTSHKRRASITGSLSARTDSKANTRTPFICKEEFPLNIRSTSTQVFTTVQNMVITLGKLDDASCTSSNTYCSSVEGGGSSSIHHATALSSWALDSEKRLRKRYTAVPNWLDVLIFTRTDFECEKPYICLLCNRGFGRDDLLNAHMQVHKDVTSFECLHPECKETFMTLEDLRNHHQEPHENKDFMRDPVTSGTAGVSRRSSRRRGLIETTHCNCGLTRHSISNDFVCCTDDECPCVLKGVLCVACGCRHCQNRVTHGRKDTKRAKT